MYFYIFIVDPKKADTKECTLYDFIYMKLKERKRLSANIVVISGEKIVLIGIMMGHLGKRKFLHHLLGGNHTGVNVDFFCV